MEDYIQTVYEKTKLKEGKIVVEKILFDIYFNQPISTKALAQENLLPIPVVTAIKKELMKVGLIEQKNGIICSDQGNLYLDGQYGLKDLNQDLYHKLCRDEAFLPVFIEEMALKYKDLYDHRPQADVTVDQAHAHGNTAFKRAVLALRHQSILGKNILCVGDDDLISVALGLLLKKIYHQNGNVKTTICVFDVDERYLSYIDEIKDQYQLPIVCVRTDFRNPIPSGYENAFDTFFTDPPYTEKGLSLFLSRGIQGLKKEKGLKVFLSFGEKPVEEAFKVQQLITEQGFLIANIHKGFNTYEGASLLGNLSQMMVLKSTEGLMPKVSQEEIVTDKIYTADLRNTATAYQCRKCKEMITTGIESSFGTIEALKDKGCPHCGGTVFDKILKKPVS